MTRRSRVTCAVVMCALLSAAPALAAPSSTAFRLTPGATRARVVPGQLVVESRCPEVLVAGNLSARILDLRGRELGAWTHPVPALAKPQQLTLHVPLRVKPTRNLDLWRLAWRFTPQVGPAVHGVVGLSEIAEQPFLSLRGQKTLVAGSRAALRVTVRDQQNRPLPGARVALRLRVGWRTLLVRGTSSTGGELHLALDVPESWAGRWARLRVIARRGPFERRYQERVSIKREAQALLTTDKPIYQPGQTVHLRVLALRQPRRRPIASRKVRFRMRDRRGTLLSEQQAVTDTFGVAFIALPLSEGLRPGPVRLEAEVDTDGRHTVVASRTVKVYRYQVPDFRVRLTSARGFAQPGGKVELTLRASYLSGQPVRSAPVKVSVDRRARVARSYGRRGQVRHCERPLQKITGRTDAKGQWEFQIRVPRNRFFCGGIGAQQLRFSAVVVAPGGVRQRAHRTVPVARGLLGIAVYPEAGTLIRGVPQRLYLQAARPDGAPAKAVFTVDVPVSALPPPPKRARRAKPEPHAKGGTQSVPKGLRTLTLHTDAHGIAVLTVQPTQRTLYLNLTARDRRGQRSVRSLGLSTQAPRVLVRPAPGVLRAGGRLRLALVSPVRGGTVHVDVKQGAQTVHTVTARMRGKRGTIAFRLPADVDGLLELSVRVKAATGSWRSGWAPVVVRPARWLNVDVRTDRPVYRPGGLATLAVRVTDESGQARRAAVGLRIVDQGIYELAGREPQSEHGELLLPEGARTLGTRVAGWTWPRLIREPRTKVPARVAHVLLAHLSQAVFHPTQDTLVHDGAADVPAYRKALARRLLRRLRPVWRARVRRYAQVQRRLWIAQARKRALCLGEEVSAAEPTDLSDHGQLPRAYVRDPWGHELVWVVDRVYGKSRFRVTLHSRGPDARKDNEDDLQAGPWFVAVPRLRRNHNCGVGYGMGGGGFGVGAYRARRPRVFVSSASVMGAVDRGGMRRFPSDAPEPRTRRDFRETLAVFPGLRTHADGNASVRVPLADNLTTWAITALASDRTGRLGGRVARFRTFQPFSVDVHIPPRVTRGDRITARVVIRNELTTSQVVRVVLKPGRWFTVAPQPDFRVQLRPGGAGPRLLVRRQVVGRIRVQTVPPKGTAEIPFLLQMKQLGRFELRVSARTPTHADAVARPVHVEAEGVQLRRGVAGMLASTRVFDLRLPRGVVPDTTGVEVSVEPSVMASTWGSFEGLLRRPYGCFEQTSSTTYPNVLVMRHLRQGKGSAKTRAKARAYLAQGYQRLTTFEVQSSGGFSLFGRAPAQPMLTAFGLGEFHDLRTVMKVDPALIRRVQRYLVGRQRADGTWRPEGSLIESGSTNPRNALTATAYVAFQLARSGYRGKPLFQALATLRRRGREVSEDAYALALSIRALYASGKPSHRALARRWAASLARKVLRSGARRYWKPGGRSTLMGWGRTAAVETTALAILALMETNVHLELVVPAVRWLLSKRYPGGAWSTTQATVLTLESLLEARSLIAARPPAQVRVQLDGQLLGVLHPARGSRSVPVRLHLPRPLHAGLHRLRLVPVGRGRALYRAALVYNARRAPAASGPTAAQVEFAVHWSRRKVQPGQAVAVTVDVRNRLGRRLDAPMAEIGLPPGLRLLEGPLRRLVARGALDQWERRGSRLLLYFTRLPKGRTTLPMTLLAEAPLRARIPPSRFYEYYHPETNWYAPGGQIEVRRQSRPSVTVSQLLGP